MAIASHSASFLSPSQNAAEQAAAEATTGNYSYGNASLMNRQVNTLQRDQYTTAPSFSTGAATIQPLQGRHQSVALAQQADRAPERRAREHPAEPFVVEQIEDQVDPNQLEHRSEEHTSELQSLMRIPYAVF